MYRNMNVNKDSFPQYMEFHETKKRYQAAMPDVQFPITYDEWMKLPTDQKATALFLSFFPYIVNTAKQYKTLDISGADMVHELMVTFIIQTVPMIEGNPKLYSVTNIVHVAKYSYLTRNRLQNYTQHSYKIKYDSDMELSNYQINESGDEINIFDNIPDSTDDRKQKALYLVRTLITENLDSLSPNTRKVVRCLLSGRPIPKRLGVQLTVIMQELRELLAEPASYISDIRIDCDKFSDVMICEDLIESAIVCMPDGNLAVYNGEKIIRKQHKSKKQTVSRYIFKCGKKSYNIPADEAMDLKVIDVETL